MTTFKKTLTVALLVFTSAFLTNCGKDKKGGNAGHPATPLKPFTFPHLVSREKAMKLEDLKNKDLSIESIQVSTQLKLRDTQEIVLKYQTPFLKLGQLYQGAQIPVNAHWGSHALTHVFKATGQAIPSHIKTSPLKTGDETQQYFTLTKSNFVHFDLNLENKASLVSVSNFEKTNESEDVQFSSYRFQDHEITSHSDGIEGVTGSTTLTIKFALLNPHTIEMQIHQTITGGIAISMPGTTLKESNLIQECFLKIRYHINK